MYVVAIHRRCVGPAQVARISLRIPPSSPRPVELADVASLDASGIPPQIGSSAV
jgi:hypothetical protein